MESSINATPVVCDSKQVVEYGVSNSNSTFSGKMSTYHVSGIYFSFFDSNQMCVWQITIYMVRPMPRVSSYNFYFLEFQQ